MHLSRTASPSFGRPPKISVMASASYALARFGLIASARSASVCAPSKSPRLTRNVARHARVSASAGSRATARRANLAQDFCVSVRSRAPKRRPAACFSRGYSGLASRGPASAAKIVVSRRSTRSGTATSSQSLPCLVYHVDLILSDDPDCKHKFVLDGSEPGQFGAIYYIDNIANMILDYAHPADPTSSAAFQEECRVWDSCCSFSGNSRKQREQSGRSRCSFVHGIS